MNRVFILSAVLILVVGCGGGSAKPSTAATPDAGLRQVEEFHPNGQLAAKGTVLDEGSLARRHGRWRTWFDNGQMRWEGDYRRDAVDQGQHWREWNADGSIRDDSSDGQQ